MQCMSVSNVTFDKRSLAAIQEIKRRSELFRMLSKVMPIGTMANIFIGNGVIKSSYNISQTDFEALAKAMYALPAIQRKVIRDIATMEAIYHFGAETEFWKGIANGCGFN